MEGGERVPIALLMVGRVAHGHEAGFRIVERPGLLRPYSFAGEAARVLSVVEACQAQVD
jgi:hypothetical protein